MRKTAKSMFPAFSQDADLSDAFVRLLRQAGWLPVSANGDAAAQAEALGIAVAVPVGKHPAPSLSPCLRVMATLAQSVLFGPSRRMAHQLWSPFASHLSDVDWEVFLQRTPWRDTDPREKTAPRNKDKKSNAGDAGSKQERSPLLAVDHGDGGGGYGAVVSSAHGTTAPATTVIDVRSPPAAALAPSDVTATGGDVIYACHRVVARNVIGAGDVGRLPRFQAHWTLEIHCARDTGAALRARVTGVRVVLLDDEAAMAASASCQCCGDAAEWREHRGELAEQVRTAFGVELESKGEGDPF